MKDDPDGRGWFAMPGRQDGDRTLEEQLLGLEPLFARAPGASVLDLGCAEGLIALELMKSGATLVHGVDCVPARFAKARALFHGRDAAFFGADLSRFATRPPGKLLPRYDLVLVLSIAHKFVQPEAFLQAAASRCSGTLAVRLPAAVLSHARSGWRPLDVPALLTGLGFAWCHDAAGPRGEWVGLFERR